MKLFSPRVSLILIGIHVESHMNTYQGGRNRLNKKSLGYICVILAVFTDFLSCIYRKQKKSLNSRSSHQRCSIEKAVFKHFSIFTGKHLCWSFFLIELQTCWYCIERNSNTGVFLWVLQNFYFKNTYSEENLWTTASGIPTSYC